MQYKTKLTAAIVLALLMASVTLMAMQVQPAKAAGVLQETLPSAPPTGVTPTETITTLARLSLRPNPVGLGQTVIVNAWLHPSVNTYIHYWGFKLTITKPDGTVNVITMQPTYSEGFSWYEFVPDQLGEWKVKFDFPGCYFPKGTYNGVGTPEVFSYYGDDPTVPGYYFNFSSYYLPSSAEERTFTVQADMVASWPPSPLPTDYWTRPVSPENREWYPIMGDYPWVGPGGGAGWPADTSIYEPGGTYGTFTPYVQAPDTAHIVWRRLGAISGMQGGASGTTSFGSGGGTPTIIYQGRCYQTVTKSMMQLINGTDQSWPTSVWECYDLRTGQVYWDITGVTAPTFIEYNYGASAAGTEAAVTASLVAIAGGRMIKYNPYTGAATLNVSIAPFTTWSNPTYYMNGYALSVQVINDGGLIGRTYGINGTYRLINWTTLGNSADFSSRIMNNISWPWGFVYVPGVLSEIIVPPETQAHSITAKLDVEAGYCVSVQDIKSLAGALIGIRIIGVSLTTGATTFNITDDPWINWAVIADHGKVAVPQMGKGTIKAWNLATGTLAWTSSPVMDMPWDGLGAYSEQSAYGMIFKSTYGGVYAFDWDTGNMVWHFKAPTQDPYESTYADENGTTWYSFNAANFIADGKVFMYNTEHSPTNPLTRGWKLFCVNATTGENIWNITGPMSPGAVADGYLAASNTYDGYMYVFGQGKSATTVTAPQTAVPLGTSVMIQGTVLDQSPGDQGSFQNPTQRLDSQKTVPCVSAASMETQMEYLYMQHPIDGLLHNEILTGVPVTLSAISSNGTYISIGTTTTNGYSGAYGLAWTPPNEDTYTINANFAADASYGSSMATTTLAVGPAPAEVVIPPQTEPVDNTNLLYGVLAAVIIAIIIGLAAVLLALRKH